MNNIHTYIDKCLIQEYGVPTKNGYELDLDDLPENEIHNFLDCLMSDDTSVRDLVKFHMQQLINKRLSTVEV